MSEPIGCGLLLGLATLGLFARGTELDDVAHVTLGSSQIMARVNPARLGLEHCAVTLPLEHGDSEPITRYPERGLGSVTIPLDWGKTPLFEQIGRRSRYRVSKRASAGTHRARRGGNLRGPQPPVSQQYLYRSRPVAV